MRQVLRGPREIWGKRRLAKGHRPGKPIQCFRIGGAAFEIRLSGLTKTPDPTLAYLARLFSALFKLCCRHGLRMAYVSP